MILTAVVLIVFVAMLWVNQRAWSRWVRKIEQRELRVGNLTAAEAKAWDDLVKNYYGHDLPDR